MATKILTPAVLQMALAADSDISNPSELLECWENVCRAVVLWTLAGRLERWAAAIYLPGCQIRLGGEWRDLSTLLPRVRCEDPLK